MPNPLISIIIPVFNTREYLSACLSSVTSQSFSKLEIICIDDGSTDGSSDILRRHKEQDNRIKLITQMNLGASAAKNQGLAMASGDYFSIVDSDDVLLPEALSIMYEAIRIDEADIVHGGYVSHNQNTGRRRPHMKKREILVNSHKLEAILSKSIHHDPWAKLFRRALFVDNKLLWPESSRFATDILIIHQAFHFAERVLVIPDLVYKRAEFRQGSLTNQFSAKSDISDRLQSRSDIADFIRSQGIWEIHKDSVRHNNEAFFKHGLLRRMILHAKGSSCHSIKDIISACKTRLPEFYFSERENVQTIMQIMNENTIEYINCTAEEKKQIIRYINEYLIELKPRKTDLASKELLFVKIFESTFNNRIHANNLSLILHRSCNVNRLKSLLIRLKQITQYDSTQCKIGAKWLLNYMMQRTR